MAEPSVMDPDAQFRQVTAVLGSWGWSMPLEIVVGFNGSESSSGALEAARQVAADYTAHLHVIYVATIPFTASLGPAYSEVYRGFDFIARDFRRQAAAMLGSPDLQWTFQRRDGAVGRQLLAAASEFDRSPGRRNVLIVVGSSQRRHRQIKVSVPDYLTRRSRFALRVVTTSPSHNQREHDSG